MYLLYCDESNLDKAENNFFVYGGLVIEASVGHSLSQQIDELRKTAGVLREFALKFNPTPSNLDHGKFIALKQAVIEAAIAHKCVFLSSLILHDIASSPDDARRKEINRICFHYNCYLSRLKSHGLVLIDRFEDKRINGHVREKFSIGITGLPYSKEHRLDRIIGFHYAAIGQSHFGSIVDIVLGSFRFAVNAFTRNDEQRLPTARRLLEIIAPLFYREEASGSLSELSLFFSPKIIKADKFRQRYADLKAFLAENAISAKQAITNERTY